VSTAIFPVTSKRAGGHKARLWLGYHDRRRIRSSVTCGL